MPPPPQKKKKERDRERQREGMLVEYTKDGGHMVLAQFLAHTTQNQIWCNWT